jgi:L-rhamnose-H+ transport protein
MAADASGWALLLFAGAANATFGLPMKFVRRWEWENTWAAWTVFALVVLPGALTLGGVSSLTAIYRGPGLQAALLVFFLGAGWGLAQVLFGKAIDSIGIGLAFSIVLGLSAACGTVLPLLRMQAASSAAAANLRVLFGLLLVAFGIVVCAIAGQRRQAAQSAQNVAPRAFTPGLLMALGSGVLASFMNVGLAFAGPLLARGAAQGLSPTRSMFAVWLVLLLGGAIPNLLYCGFLLQNRKTWRLYRGTGQVRNFGLAGLMALLWFFSTILYGVATQWLGAWGVVLGWPAFMSVIVITAGLLGIVSGEWAHSGRAPVLFQIAGVLLLVLAIVAFSLAQNALQRSEQARTVSPSSFTAAYVR